VKGRATFRVWRWDGKRIAAHRGGIPLDDRGFRYGQHLFESIAVRNGSALLAREHLSLLSAAAKRHAIPFSRSLAPSLRSFLGSVKLPDGMLRIYLTAGAGAPCAPITTPGCYLAWEATRFPTEEELAAGYRLVISGKAVAAEDWGEKSGNYGSHLTVLADARKAGADEAIVPDEQGRILSCAMGNLLVWLPTRSGTILCTPPASSGARSGAVLAWVRRKAPLHERPLRPADLRRAVALAVTNSRLGVMPVALLDGKPLSHPGPAQQFARDYLRSHGLLRGA
jgi:branched-subunit amino acid aminotransferase/4-amino-4-deoxychorismate lyase